MQKLEEILRAEETARHSLAEARERSRAVIKEAEIAAAEMTAQERARTLEETASIERSAEEAAQREADTIRTRADAELTEVLARAKGRMSSVIERIVAELAG